MNGTQEILAKGSLALASVSGASSYFGWFDYINSNASGIGVIISFISLIIGSTFAFKASKKQEKAEVNEKKIEVVESNFEKRVTKIESDMSEVKDGVSKILKVMDKK